MIYFNTTSESIFLFNNYVLVKQIHQFIINMRHFISFILIILGINGFSQSVRPYFSAIIVEDIEVSKAWYIEKFGFSTLSEISNEAQGFKQVNLSLEDDLLIELLEIDAASNLNNSTETTQFAQGYFKIGFLIKNFDQMVENLKLNNVVFHGNIVRDEKLQKRMVIIKDPDGNRIQLFEDI